MRIALVALLVALTAVPAYAQRAHIPPGTPKQKQNEAEKKKKAAEIDKAYKSSLGNIPDQKPADPWGKMR